MVDDFFLSLQDEAKREASAMNPNVPHNIQLLFNTLRRVLDGEAHWDAQGNDTILMSKDNIIIRPPYTSCDQNESAKSTNHLKQSADYIDDWISKFWKSIKG